MSAEVPPFAYCVIDHFHELSIHAIVKPSNPLSSWEVVEYCKYVQLEKFIPPATQLDGIEKAAFFSNDSVL